MRYQGAHHRGFSLIELMIGLAISLVGLLAIGQIMLTFSQQRNTISQTMNTQNNGVMALYLMERDLSQAGYGMMGLGCDRINYYFNGTGYYNSPYSTTNLPGASTGNIALTELPVRILSGGTGSDTIEVQYGRSTSGVPGAEIIADQSAYSSDYSIAAGAGFAVNDLFIARSGGICTLAQVTAVTSPDPSHAVGATYPVTTAISHAATPGVGYNVTVGPGGTGWNIVADTEIDTSRLAKSPAVNASPKPSLSNLGAFVSRRYVVSGNSLRLAELANFSTATASLPAQVDDILLIKAQYGLAASSGTTAVTTWADGGDPATTAYDSTLAGRIVAIRVGVIARSPLIEKTAVNAPSTLSILPAVSGTSTLADPAAGLCATDTASREVKCTMSETRYRYRAYSTIIPLKNAIWTR